MKLFLLSCPNFKCWPSNLKTLEYKRINHFFQHWIEWYYSCFNLSKRILESKVVKRFLRYLHERFKPQVIVEEESKNLDIVKSHKLIWSLQTYEISFHPLKKSKKSLLEASSKENVAFEDKSEQSFHLI